MLNCSLKVSASYVLWFLFLTQHPRVWLSLFPMLIWCIKCVIWQAKFIGRFYAQQGMKGWRILLWMDSTPFKLTSLGLRSTILYFHGTCWPGYRWRAKFPLPLPTLLQLWSYPVLCISARIFTIPKLQNIHCWHFISELFSVLSASNIFLIVFSVRPSPFFRYVREDWSFTDHLSRALPTEKIFYLLRSIRSESLISCSPELVLDILKVIVEWLEVSVGECMRQTSH